MTPVRKSISRLGAFLFAQSLIYNSRRLYPGAAWTTANDSLCTAKMLLCDWYFLALQRIKAQRQ